MLVAWMRDDFDLCVWAVAEALCGVVLMAIAETMKGQA